MDAWGQNGSIQQDTGGETGTILVVDDLPENAIILKQFLEPARFRVDAVQSGEEALTYIEKTPPDLVLLDLVMPGMSGFDVCRYLKNSPSTRHIPVIIITGLADREANIRAVEAGADDFLIKPFDRVLLMARINTSFRTKKLQDALLSYQQQLEERVRERTREVEKTREVAVFSLARLAESRDTETGDHLDRIRRYVRLLGAEMRNWGRYPEFSNPRYVDELYLSSPLHDIGKVGIPDKILLKPGKLT
ncbi:MAG TPA: response regulator, partial [Candidatus Hydrogenedentes bacterium]|nr:response regulator [Candidatus Hydrogenedentota bacterium]